jgi:putative ABC transport system permease protein
MRLLYQIAALFRALFRSERIDADLADEMRFHVDRETEANASRGMTPEAARRAANLKFGGVGVAQETSRDDRPGAFVRRAIGDMRFGARLLAKAPVFGFTGIAIVALGIGAATAIFSVVYGVMLQPLPFHEPERLVSISMSRAQVQLYPTAADAFELRQLRMVFKDVGLIRTANANLNLIGDGEPQRLQSARVSPNMFSVLGVPPMLGRAFAADEDQLGHERVVILSEALWRTRFGGNREIVGRPINLDGTPYTVVGVMPSSFQYPTTGIDAWITAVLEPGELARTAINNYRLVARLDSRVSLEQARREAAALCARLGNSYPWNKDAVFTVDSMLESAVRSVRPALGLLLGAVSFLLLIACVNLSNLFGARATARSGEFAVRLALGASRTRLIAQAIAEAAPILAVGGVLGILLAKWVVQAFIANAPTGLPRVESIALSGPVVLYSFAVLFFTGLAASLAPAVQAWRSDFTRITKEGSRSSTTGRGRALARRVGVAAQVAFTLPLLVGASLLIQSAMQVSRVNLGFTTDNVATLAFEPSRTKHATEQGLGDYYTRLIEAITAVPGVSSAAVVNRIPLVGGQTNMVTPETPTGGSAKEFYIDSRTVTGEYFKTLGIPVLAGRTFSTSDDSGAPRVVIVDEHIARQMWPAEQAIGKRIRGGSGEPLTVIGIVGHIRTAGVEVDPRPQVYWPVRQWPQIRAVMAVRSDLDTRTLFPAVIKAMRSVDPDQSVFELRTMQDIVDGSLAQRRVTTLLMIGFGAIALLLAAIGIYGVVAYGVTQRLREFGIRSALGATRREVTRLVVWQGMSMAVAGSAVGLVLALAAAGVMSNLVYGVAPRDAASLVGATCILFLVAALASYFPARRAASVDPAVTLRAE